MIQFGESPLTVSLQRLHHMNEVEHHGFTTVSEIDAVLLCLGSLQLKVVVTDGLGTLLHLGQAYDRAHAPPVDGRSQESSRSLVTTKSHDERSPVVSRVETTPVALNKQCAVRDVAVEHGETSLARCFVSRRQVPGELRDS